MLAFALGATAAPVLHDTAKVREAYKCTSTICYGADGGMTHGWFVETQTQINRIGARLFGGWTNLKTDGMIGAATVAAARKVFPKVPVLASAGFSSPGSKEQLALWIRGLEFTSASEPTFLPGQLKKFADGLSSTTQPPLVASGPSSSPTGPSQIPNSPDPGMRTTGVTSLPVGPTASGGSAATQTTLTAQRLPGGAQVTQAGFFPGVTAVGALSTPAKVAIGVGAVGVVGGLAWLLLRR